MAMMGHTKLTTAARYASVATGMIAAVDSPLKYLGQTKGKKGKKGASYSALTPSHRCKQRLSGSRSKLEVADGVVAQTPA